MNIPATTAEVKRLLTEEWRPVREDVELPMGAVRQLVEEKYGRDEWNRRR
jgi:hypothetical protein